MNYWLYYTRACSFPRAPSGSDSCDKVIAPIVAIAGFLYFVFAELIYKYQVSEWVRECRLGCRDLLNYEGVNEK